MKTRLVPALLGFAFASVFSAPANAFEEGDWLLRFGASNVSPKSNNHSIVDVDDQVGVTFNFSYMMTDNWAFELLAALPYDHDIHLLDGTKVAEAEHLPPTASIQFHFNPGGKFNPYAGLGLNYTVFLSEDTFGPLAGTDLDLDSSWGLAGQLGVDFMFSEKWFLNMDVRYIDIDTDAKLDGVSLGTVEIDPWVYGLNLGYRF